MAAHPYAPGCRSDIRALKTGIPHPFDGYNRYEAIIDSPSHGFQLCLGTTAEGLKNPGEREGTPGAHAQHPRGLYSFAEVYPDEGEMDFLK